MIFHIAGQFFAVSFNFYGSPANIHSIFNGFRLEGYSSNREFVDKHFQFLRQYELSGNAYFTVFGRIFLYKNNLSSFFTIISFMYEYFPINKKQVRQLHLYWLNTRDKRKYRNLYQYN